MLEEVLRDLDVRVAAYDRALMAHPTSMAQWHARQAETAAPVEIADLDAPVATNTPKRSRLRFWRRRAPAAAQQAAPAAAEAAATAAQEGGGPAAEGPRVVEVSGAALRDRQRLEFARAQAQRWRLVFEAAVDCAKGGKAADAWFEFRVAPHAMLDLATRQAAPAPAVGALAVDDAPWETPCDLQRCERPLDARFKVLRSSEGESMTEAISPV